MQQYLLPTVPQWKRCRATASAFAASGASRISWTGWTSSSASAQIAEAEDHHPDLHLAGYRNVTIEMWTHAVGGLTENDFILAAKIDQRAGGVET